MLYIIYVYNIIYRIFSVFYIVKRMVITYQFCHCLLFFFDGCSIIITTLSTIVASILLPDPRTAIFSLLK